MTHNPLGKSLLRVCTLYIDPQNFNMLRPVNGVDGVPGSEEAAVAAVALVDEGVAARAALDHRVEVPARPLARVLLVAPRRALVLQQPVQQSGYGGRQWFISFTSLNM